LQLFDHAADLGTKESRPVMPEHLIL